jgi:hypothetical protein
LSGVSLHLTDWLKRIFVSVNTGNNGSKVRLKKSIPIYFFIYRYEFFFISDFKAIIDRISKAVVSIRSRCYV